MVLVVGTLLLGNRCFSSSIKMRCRTSFWCRWICCERYQKEQEVLESPLLLQRPCSTD